MSKNTRHRQFIEQQLLPPQYLQAIDSYFQPLIEQLIQKKKKNSSMVVGISGAQGSGKSTLAAMLSLLLQEQGYRCYTLSIDDIYLRKSDRLDFAKKNHPLFTTRGVPGTHDVQLGIDTINQLKNLGRGESCPIVRFNKSIDDRAAAEQWDQASGPVDFILFEGWCVAASPQSANELQEPVNDVEKNEDGDRSWRKQINDLLKGPYTELFSLIDYLVFIQAPSFDKVLEWRTEQEDKLEQKTGKRGMSASEIERFILLDQRITMDNLNKLPQSADAVLTLDEQHAITGLKTKNSGYS